MQWVVTTGRTVAEARERALDVLGIDDDELEFEVLEEPSSTLFGLRTTEARVRARVRPTRPRPKVDRRTRRPKSGGRKRRSRRSGSKNGSKKGSRSTGDAKSTDSGAATQSEAAGDSASAEPIARTESSARKGRRRAAPPPAGPSTDEPATPSAPRADTTESPSATPSRPAGTEGSSAMSDIALDDQEPTAIEFVTGLVEAFGATATVTAERLEEDDALELHVDGEDLGLLVGQRGTTLSSIAELTRTAVAQQHSGRLEGRLRVDIAGYRAKRKEALIRFAGQVADKVLEDGKAVALEPMSPPDRKIVHDAINDIDGVHTSSRGEDRRRHVVVHPD